MDLNFWAGILLGVVLSIPAGFFVNLHTERVQRWLDNRRMVSQSHSLEREKAEYGRILRLRSDYHFATQFHCSRIVQLISAFSLVILFAVMQHWHAESAGIGKMTAGIVAFFLILTQILLFRYLRVLRKLGHFEAYRDELQNRWSDEIWDVPPSREGR